MTQFESEETTRPYKIKDPVTGKITYGKTSAKETYSEWLKRQDPDFQKSILGPKRFELYKSGKVDFKDFSSTRTNQVISVKDLEAKYGVPGLISSRGNVSNKIGLSLKEATVTKNVTGIVSYIDQNSFESLDLGSLRKQISDASQYGVYGKTKVNLSKLKIQDKADVIKDIKKSGDKIVMKPIVVDSEGFVIDGRHRAVKALLRGDKTIEAFMPITKKK